MAILNSNPEILLRKRKNADRKRLEKQEQIRERQILKKTLKKKRTKFIRPETLISNHKSNELERKRYYILAKCEISAGLESKSTLPHCPVYADRLIDCIVTDHCLGESAQP